MQDSNIPTKIIIPWATSAGGTYINAIPNTSQIGVNPGFASWPDGFVPLNATPVASGGVPPRIQDWNGALFDLSAWSRWLQAGGPIAYDSAFQTAVGGYPNGAVIQSAAYPGTFWLSIVDNNTSDPDTGGANWVRYLGRGMAVITATGNFTVPSYVTQLKYIATGGGGGGSNCSTSSGSSGDQSGGGGGAGGTAIGVVAVTPGSTIAVTVGAGGAAQTDGGATSFALVVANGGTHSSFASIGVSAGGSGGGASVGQINITGGYGSDGQSGNVVGFGNGGASFWGGGGRAGSGGGVTASAYGAGGGGAYDPTSSGTTYFGGTGAGGIVVFEW